MDNPREMVAKERAILEKQQRILLGAGTEVPTPAKCIVFLLRLEPSPLPGGLGKCNIIICRKECVDIRHCIDYRLINQLANLMHYPLSLIDAFDRNVMWCLSLVMASGFWDVPMARRAQYISVFTGLLIYQQMLEGCIWGLVRLPGEGETRWIQKPWNS
ncbi:LOW QUALITY PROTEIN: reverse transcriptase [Phytophthora megakarya]|uniref:Reverse transcriptase n=1 Tax=Phytophthora megakarya TaxID=4795 RepID=A0A225WCD7_9STRA|nr:LOW QUALITY PROTEIN: reverse transcriptase [Phytophthora megakarya]